MVGVLKNCSVVSVEDWAVVVSGERYGVAAVMLAPHGNTSGCAEKLKGIYIRLHSEWKGYLTAVADSAYIRVGVV